MNSPQGLAESVEVVGVVELGRIAATPFKHTKPLAVRVVKCFIINPHGCDNRNFVIYELLGKRMLFEYLRVGPSTVAVKLHDNRLRPLNTHLIDTILVAVQR